MKRVLKSKSNIKKADRILRKRNVSKAQDGAQAYPYDTNPGIDMEKYLRSQDVRGRIAKQYFEFVNPNPTNEELESYINSEIDRRISDYRRLKEIPWDERNERVRSELKKTGLLTDEEIDKAIAYDDIVLRGVYTGGRNHDISMNPSPGFSNQTPFDSQSTKFHETYHGINRGGQTPMELAKFDPVVLDRPDDERAKLNQSNYEGIAQGKIGKPIYMDTKGNVRTASRARDGSQGTYDRKVEELGPRLWQLRNWAHQMGISKDGGNLTPEQIDQIINFDFSDTSKIRPEDASLIKELIDDLHNRLVKIPKQYNSDEEIPDDYKDYDTLKSRLLESMNYFVDTEGKNNSAVSTAKQGGRILRKRNIPKAQNGYPTPILPVQPTDVTDTPYFDFPHKGGPGDPGPAGNFNIRDARTGEEVSRLYEPEIEKYPKWAPIYEGPVSKEYPTQFGTRNYLDGSRGTAVYRNTEELKNAYDKLKKWRDDREKRGIKTAQTDYPEDFPDDVKKNTPNLDITPYEYYKTAEAYGEVSDYVNSKEYLKRLENYRPGNKRLYVTKEEFDTFAKENKLPKGMTWQKFQELPLDKQRAYRDKSEAQKTQDARSANTKFDFIFSKPGTFSQIGEMPATGRYIFQTPGEVGHSSIYTEIPIIDPTKEHNYIIQGDIPYESIATTSARRHAFAPYRSESWDPNKISVDEAIRGYKIFSDSSFTKSEVDDMMSNVDITPVRDDYGRFRDSSVQIGPINYYNALNAIRSVAKENGIHKNFGENFTKEQLDKVKKIINKDKNNLYFIKDDNELLRHLNTIASVDENSDNSIMSAEQGGRILKKQLGGLASLPFNRLIKNKNMENSFKYQQGGFSSLLEQMINESKPSFSTKSAEGNQYLSMPINDQKQYFQKLSQYVSDYGVEALSQNPEAEEFFFEFSKKTAAPAVPNARFSTDPPVQGGTYVSATVSAKRVEQDPIKDFIRSPKIQSENFQNFSETKIPEILLEDYEVSVSMPKSMGFINSDTLADLGLKTTVYGPEISESKRTLKRVKQAKNGGNIYSKMGLKPMGIFNSGGTVSPAFQRNMPVGNSKRIDGYIPMDNLIPIQTERDELIVLPSKDVVKVNATKRHSKMTDDEVTDIVPDGSYILSQYGDVDIYKEEADNYIIETKNKPYNLHQQNQPPSIKTLGSFMSKKKMKPADLARKILAKYKTVNLDDPFVNDTNRANKFTASRYLDAIIELSELDKKRKGLDENPEAQMYEQSPEMFARNGGKALKSSYKMPKYEAGAIAGAAAGLLSGVLSAYTDSQNRKLLKQNTAASLADIANLSKRQMGYENLGLAAGLFNPQDPTYREPRYQFGYLQGIRNQGLGNQELDYITNRSFANLNAGQNARTYDAREAASLNSLGYASALDNMSKAGLENARRKDAINIDYYKNLGAGMQFNEAARNKEFNMITANVNKNLADRTAQIMASMGNRQNLLNNEMALRLAARNQQTPALIQMNNQLAQSLMNSANLGLQTYSTLNKSAATPTYVGTVGDPNFSYQGPYAPGTRMCQDAKGNIIPC
jgi:hypothetical protein